MDISSRAQSSTSKNVNIKELLVKYKSLLGLVLLIAVVSILNPSFLSPKNIMNILRQTSVNAVIAAGMTFVILTGGIDLSVGSILGISGAVCASILVSGQNVVIAVLAALVVGVVVGFLNGFIISKGKLQPFIATLATMTVLKGLTLVYTNGIPTPAMIMILVFMVCYYILHNTKMGRYTYALGSNEEATKLSGLNTDKIKIWVYTISGILASIAGIIITSRLYSAQPTAGSGYELDAIAAVVLGGTSLNGGKGKITGTIIGALIIGVLSNALNILDVSSYYQTMVKGAVILLAVLLDRKSN